MSPSVMSSPKAQDKVSDENLMCCVRDTADLEAYGRLYDRHASRAYRVARSVCGDVQRSEEAVQDGFLAVWRGRSRSRPMSGSGSFRAWSMTLVRRAAIDILRRESADCRPSLRAPQDDAPDVTPGASPEHDVIARDEAATLRETLARLPAAQAEVIGLAFFGELSHSEVAAHLALPLGTVKGRMRLGLEKLRVDLPDNSSAVIENSNRLSSGAVSADASTNWPDISSAASPSGEA